MKKELAAERAQAGKKRHIDDAAVREWYLPDANKISQAKDENPGDFPNSD